MIEIVRRAALVYVSIWIGLAAMLALSTVASSYPYPTYGSVWDEVLLDALLVSVFAILPTISTVATLEATSSSSKKRE